MKKHTLNISVVSIMCVLCAVSVGDAFAAGSVRALGGSGTYNGTAAATSSATRSGTATRAGSLRISPSTTRSVSAGTRTNSDGTTTPTERLSIGKYLGGATSVSTGGGSSSGGGSGDGPSAAEIDTINQNITNLFNTTQTLEGDITNLENTKQDNLSAGDYIKIDNDEVSLDITELEEYLTTNLHLPNPIDIQYDSTNDILKWTKDGTTWINLLSLSDLTGDYVSTAELEQAIQDLATKSAVDALTERVTTAEGAITELQSAVANIPDAQVQSDWNQTDTTAVDFIKNKPTIPANIATTDDLAGYATTQDLANKADKNIIGDGFDADNTVADAIDDLADAVDAIVVPEQQQSDWNVADDQSPAFIKNKPTIPDTSNFVTSDDLDDYATTQDLAGKQDKIDSEHPLSADLVDGLATVATSGSYNDLLNVPTIPEQVQANWTETDDTEPSFIKNKPTDLVKTADLEDYAKTEDLDDYATTQDLAGKQDKIDSEHPLSADLVDGLATVATSGSYNDLDNKPTIPDAQVNSDWNASSGVAEILNKPDLSNYVANPTLPSGEGNYLLKVNNDNGTYTYSWADADDYDNASGGGSGGDPTGPDFDWDDSGW